MTQSQGHQEALKLLERRRDSFREAIELWRAVLKVHPNIEIVQKR